MATIANLYHTDLTTKTQLLIAENVDLEKVVTKYHPQTKETFILYLTSNDDDARLAKISNNVLVADVLIIANFSSGYIDFNLSLNYKGDRGLIVLFWEIWPPIDNNTRFYDLENMTLISSKSNGFIGVANVIHTGTNEQYYIAAGSTLYRYNADTQSVMHSITPEATSKITSMSVYLEHVYISVHNDGDNNTTVYKYDYSLSNVGSWGGFGDQSKGDLVVNQKIYYTSDRTDNNNFDTIYIHNFTSITEIGLLNTYNIYNPSGLATETTTNRVLFSATDNATGNHNLYELKSDNTIELIAGYEKLGGYSNNNDFMGGQLDLVFE